LRIFSPLTPSMRLLICFAVLLFARCTTTPPAPPLRTQVILLGTGTPNADPERFGPATAIVVDSIPYIVDCGPGVVRRATAVGLDAARLNRLFITHLHSDHTTGYPDFVFTPAVLERTEPLQVFGPPGTRAFSHHIEQAYQEDYNIRIFGLEKGDSLAYRVAVNEVSEGEIYRDERVRVIAFPVKHGSWTYAYGYTFITPDRTIVVSGDCTFSEEVIRQCNGCDVLVHEVFSEDGYSRRPPKWKTYHADFHTSTTQLAEIANRAKPKLLVLTHQLIWDSSEEKLLEEIRSRYAGRVVSGKDLGVY
jgi:ribonuclease BN (tRNA processing enzyme)